LAAKNWKVLGRLAAKKTQIRGRNYNNTIEPNSSFRRKNQTSFLLSITNTQEH